MDLFGLDFVTTGTRLLFVPVPGARVVGAISIAIGGGIAYGNYNGEDEYGQGDPRYGGYTSADEKDAVELADSLTGEESCQLLEEAITALENRVRGRELNINEDYFGTANDTGHPERLATLTSAKNKLQHAVDNGDCKDDDECS